MPRTPFLLLLSVALSLPATWSVRGQTTGYVGCLRIQQVSREECEALESFFNVTNGRSWINNSEWF